MSHLSKTFLCANKDVESIMIFMWTEEDIASVKNVFTFNMNSNEFPENKDDYIQCKNRIIFTVVLHFLSYHHIFKCK